MTESPFAIRGVIEGFYGNPWRHDQRLAIIRFLGAHGLNTFFYAPKDDPLLRREWRRPYEGAALARLAELVAAGAESGVDLAWCVSPGLSIAYSDEAEIERLVAKCAAVGALGITRFGLLLDDIPPELQHQADRAAFPDLAAAHAHLVRRVATALRAVIPDAHLTVCPTVYWGYGTEPYLAALGAAIPAEIDLFWTGRAICSPTLDLADAAVFARTAGRPALYWDNYPVNDVAMAHELHVGPYRGRDPQLWRFARGVIANPMELFESSKIALATIAAYLADPAGYDPEASWARAIGEVTGNAEDAAAYAAFADNVRSSCLATDDAPVVARALERFGFLAEDDPAAAGRELAPLAGRLAAAAAHLRRGDVANRDLIDEAAPWLEAFETGAGALGLLARLATEGRLADAPVVLGPWLDALRRARVRVFGDALLMFFADLVGSHPRPGRFPGAGAIVTNPAEAGPVPGGATR